MRIALRDRHEVAHVWAQNSQGEGRAGNMFFENEKIYSYGRHFCIARILPSGTVAFTSRDYSPSTSQHKYIARNAVNHRAIVYCNNPADSAAANMREARAEIARALQAAQKPRIRQTTRDSQRARALRIAENANAYLAALPADEVTADAFAIDVTSLESLRVSLETYEAAQAAIREEQRKQRAADLAESLAQWRMGEIYTQTGLYELPPALRLSADRSEVQTSHGATIPIDAARALWPLVEHARAGSREWEPRRVLGPYRLTKIRADGSIVVGCHDIAYIEIRGIAESLNLIPCEVQ